MNRSTKHRLIATLVGVGLGSVVLMMIALRDEEELPTREPSRESRVQRRGSFEIAEPTPLTVPQGGSSADSEDAVDAPADPAGTPGAPIPIMTMERPGAAPTTDAAAASDEGLTGGTLIRVRGQDGSRLRDFRVAAISNPYPTVPTSWQPGQGGFGVSGGGSVRAQARGETCFVPWLASELIGVLVVPREDAPFMREAVPSAPPGQPPQEVELSRDAYDAQGASLKVNVIGDDGDPWTLGTVRAVAGVDHPITSVDWWYRLAPQDATVGAPGVFHFRNLIPESYQVQVMWRDQVLQHHDVGRLEDGTDRSVTVRLPGLSSLLVNVTYHGRPVNAFRVSAQAPLPRDRRQQETGPWPATSSPDGTAELVIPKWVHSVFLSLRCVQGTSPEGTSFEGKTTSDFGRGDPRVKALIGTLDQEYEALLRQCMHRSGTRVVMDRESGSTSTAVTIDMRNGVTAMDDRMRAHFSERLDVALAKDAAASQPVFHRPENGRPAGQDLESILEWLLFSRKSASAR